MKREEKRQQTRQLLLDTTHEMIEEKGCGQLTLQDIMERSGLSKGAIYHYVKSKDELLALVLQDRLADTNHKFQQAANLDVKTYEAPMQMILHNLTRISESKDVTNQILIYLMSKNDQPAIAEILQQFHSIALEQSQQWIEKGQQAGVISPSVPADRIAQLFVLISHGVRMRSAFTTDTAQYGTPEIAEFMKSILHPQHAD